MWVEARPYHYHEVKVTCGGINPVRGAPKEFDPVLYTVGLVDHALYLAQGCGPR